MKPYSLTSIAGTCLFFVFIFVYSCKQRLQKDDRPDANVNPRFEQAPPPVGDITIKELKDTAGGNVLFTANFAQALGKEKFHAVMLGEEKIVLRDDGKGGDEKESDGIFSVVLREDVNELRTELSGITRSMVARKEFVTFNGRTMQRIPMEDFRLQEISRFGVDMPIKIPPFLFPCLPSITIDKEKSLMITSPSVVEDSTRTFNPCNQSGNPNGAWSFPHLISEMANTASTGVSAQDFLMNWLKTWETNQTVNADVIAARTQIAAIIDSWKTASGGSFDIKFAPFKLIAIVNRVDLRGNSGYGMSNPGEGRFVFCATRCNGTNITVFNNPRPFMVIFEYGIPKKTCSDLKAFAKQWADLSGMVLGSAAYNNALQVITDQFTAANLNPAKPNGSSLNQIRTNEFGLTVLPWELREYNIDSVSHQLKNVTTKQEPQTSFNRIHVPNTPSDVNIMANFVNTNTAAVIANTYSVPLIEGGRNFLAGKAHTIDPTNYHWDGTAAPGPGFITNDEARFVFSLNTCSGCHGGEANTGNFMHVGPGGIAGVPAQLSFFLKGNPPMSAGPFSVSDRANRPPGKIREFNDLERRKLDLEKFASCGCRVRIRSFALADILRSRPLNMTH